MSVERDTFGKIKMDAVNISERNNAMKQIMRAVIGLFAVVLLFVMFGPGCKDQSTNPGQTSVVSSNAGKLSFSFTSVPNAVVKVVAKLTRNGFSDQLLTLTISDAGRSASGSMTNIAAGPWYLEVDALNDSSVVLYTGSTNVDVIPGQTVSVNLQLHPPSGNIDIEVTWATGCVPVPDGLVSWWKGEGNDNDVMGLNNGTPVNGSYFASGKVGQAFLFESANNLVRIPNSPSLNPTGSFSIEGWIFPTDDYQRGAIIGKWGDIKGWFGQESWYLGLVPGGALEFSLADSAHQHDISFVGFISPYNVITLNAWNHVSGVFDKSTGTRRLYVNGVQIAEKDSSYMNIFYGTADVSIGAHLRAPDTTEYQFHGMIDEISIYNKALTDAEIQNIFISESNGKCH